MTHDPHADTPGHPAAATPGDHHATTDHGDDGEHDDHAHDGEALGPIDLWAWGAGALGVLLGLAVVLGFYLGTLDVG